MPDAHPPPVPGEEQEAGADAVAHETTSPSPLTGGDDREEGVDREEDDEEDEDEEGTGEAGATAEARRSSKKKKKKKKKKKSKSKNGAADGARGGSSSSSSGGGIVEEAGDFDRIGRFRSGDDSTFIEHTGGGQFQVQADGQTLTAQAAPREPSPPPGQAPGAELLPARKKGVSMELDFTKARANAKADPNVRINGIRVPRAKLASMLKEGVGRGSSRAAETLETKLLQRSATYGSIEQELHHWRGRFVKGMTEKEVADYNVLLTSMRKRIAARHEDLRRQHVVAQGQLAAAIRSGNQGRVEQHHKRVAKVAALAEQHNEHIALWNKYKEELQGSPAFKQLSDRVQAEWDFTEDGFAVNRKALEDDAKVTFESALAEELGRSSGGGSKGGGGKKGGGGGGGGGAGKGASGGGAAGSGGGGGGGDGDGDGDDGTASFSLLDYAKTMDKDNEVRW